MSFTESIDELVEKSTDGRVAIHPSWTRTKLSQVAKLLNGFPFASDNFSNEKGFPLIRIRDIVRGQTETFYQGDFDKQFVVDRGDLLIGMDGDFNCALWRGEPALLNQRVCKLIPDESKVDKRFLEFVLPGYLGLINRHTPSLTVKHLSSGTIKDIPLPFPPLDTQRSIAGKIEELFSDLDAGVAALKRAQANLKRYRAAVLKAAVEGRLTAQWRAQRKAKGIATEPAAKLLERILAERRKKWEAAQLKKYAGAGKAPPKGWQGKYVEPAAPDADGLSELPHGWSWATLSQVGFLDRGKSKNRPRNAPHLYGGRYPFIQTGDIRHADGVVRSFTQTYSEAGLAQSKLWPMGTLCITIAANIAETAILGLDACFPDSVVGFLPAGESVSVNYVELYIRTVRARLEQLAPATAQKNINVETLNEVAICMPPALEQTEIVSQVEAKLSNIAQAEAEIKRSLERAARLRQAILKRAFEGRLL